jgi:hypothetical protein
MPATSPALRPLTFLPLLAALLGGCGGGSDSPGPVSQIQVQFSSPADADNVHTVGTGVPLAVGVTVDGQFSADGTAVVWSAASANFAPEQSSTRSGQASTTLVGTSAGALQVQAAANASGQTASASRTLYLRPAPQPLEVLVPAYFYPLAASPWDQLSSGVQAHPAVRVTAIMNPNNGIFTSADPQFTRAIAQFTDAGGRVIGYVATRYGTGARSLEAIKLNIDRYLQFYGRDRISGIFLDEMAATTERLGFYRELYSYIKGIDSQLRVVGNPGTPPVADYASVADALVTFEGQAGAYASFSPQPAQTWLYGRTNSAQAMLVHNATSCAAMQTALRTAATPRSNTGLVYATDRLFDVATNTGNPWATLPSYWDALLSAANALNRGATLPPC